MTEGIEKALKKIGFEVSKPVHASITILFGLFVWTLPQFLSFLVGAYFIIQGILLFIDYYGSKKKVTKTDVP
jgi:uncharacterized membrane protein HdeD (DUF308 family)